jgi:hypothetical protein
MTPSMAYPNQRLGSWCLQPGTFACSGHAELRYRGGAEAAAHAAITTMPDDPTSQNDALSVEEPEAVSGGRTEPWSGHSRCGRTR